MGSQNSKFVAQQELPHEYRPVAGQPHIYESILTGHRLLKHKLEVRNEAEIKREIDVFIFRRMNADRLISAFYFQKFTPDFFCNMGHQVCFFTEQPAYMMSPELVIPADRAYSILVQCLRGFELLFNKFGPFPVRPENIYFDAQHQSKIWISPNFAVTRNVQIVGSHLDEEKMIVDLFRIFDNVRNQRQQLTNFTCYLKKILQTHANKLSFKVVIKFMVDEVSRFFVGTDRRNHRARALIQPPHINENSACRHGDSASTKRLSSPDPKLSNPNVISLKTRSRNNSRASSTQNNSKVNTAMSTPLHGLQFVVKLESDNKIKRCRRNNTQESIRTSNRENTYVKQRIVHNIYHSPAVVMRPAFDIPAARFTPIQNVKPIHDLRVPERVHLTGQSTPIYQQPVKIKRLRTQQFYPSVQKQNIVHAPIRAPESTVKIITQQKLASSMQQSQPTNRSHKVTRFDSKIEQSPSTFDYQTIDQSNMPSWVRQRTQRTAFTNLNTLKSIVSVDYSELDSQIRYDLERMT